MTDRHLHSVSDGGVYDAPDDQPYQRGTGQLVEPGQIPTCPRCGITGEASRINHPLGRYFCSCGQLYEGTDREWRRMARARRQAVERRASTNAPAQPTEGST